MDMFEYQMKARTTAVYPAEHAITYPILGLAGEAGELANKWKKVLRDDNGILSPEKRNALVEEVGDILWYIASVLEDLGADMDGVAKENLKKLASRKERGVLGGSGDQR
jgi:NTP pyrophosphatase (non-canonical NTP hydrolase)